MNYQIIKNNSELEKICGKAKQASVIALDTEFIRERTYYPQLGLIQLYDEEQVSLIDPLTITDWSAFKALLTDQQIIKLLHASGEDLDIFSHEYDLLPSPCIDTQVLAAFCSHQRSAGFAALVSDYLQITLDKSETRTDWLARPLTTRQYEYAAADVFYLIPLAKRLIEKVQQAGWLSAAMDECQQTFLRRKLVEPQYAYLDITHAWRLMPRQLGVLQKLAEWRLNYARENDMAVNFVVREELLFKIAEVRPTSLAELERLGHSAIRVHANKLLGLVVQANSLKEDQLPAVISRITDNSQYKKAVKLIKEVIQEVSLALSLSPELLASRRQINQLLHWHWGKTEIIPELLTGWRAKLFSGKLLSCLNKLA